MPIFSYNARRDYAFVFSRHAAHRHCAAALAEAHDLRVARQYLFSTRGEIAIAERAWDEAETWIRRSLAGAESHGNREHSAKCRANLALVARGRGDLDGALMLPEEARALARPLTARFLQIQIDLWLAEVYLARRERTAAAEVLARAEARLADAGYGRLKGVAAEIRGQL